MIHTSITLLLSPRALNRNRETISDNMRLLFRSFIFDLFVDLLILGLEAILVAGRKAETKPPRKKSIPPSPPPIPPL